MVTKAKFLFMIQSINLPPSAHTITSSAHCSTLQPSAAYSQTSSAHPVHTLQQPLHLQCTHYSSHYIFSAHCNNVQPCTAICSQSSVHSAANCSHLQPPTLQLYHSVHTATILSSAHYIYTIQCTLQLHYLMLIPYSASSEEG